MVHRVKPTILIGTSTQAGAFNEPIVREMAATVDRPIILPLSNPTSKAEALPADLIAWTDGRVLTATGSPFEPVEHNGMTYEIAQSNNALVFPGLGLGVAVTKATRISNAMIAAAANAVADPGRRRQTRRQPPPAHDRAAHRISRRSHRRRQNRSRRRPHPRRTHQPHPASPRRDVEPRVSSHPTRRLTAPLQA